MKNFETLEVGKTYMNRNGEHVKIAHTQVHDTYPYMSEDLDSYTFDGNYYTYCTSEYDLILLVDENKKEEKRPHADLIIQWANNKNLKIQVKRKDSEVWIDTPSPDWYEGFDYRIKPEPIFVDKFLYVYQISDGAWHISSDRYSEEEAKEKFKVPCQKIEDSKITVEV